MMKTLVKAVIFISIKLWYDIRIAFEMQENVQKPPKGFSNLWLYLTIKAQ